MLDENSLPSVAPGGWIVLGLLVQESPQSGYDLASRATRGIAHFWPITKAQVYAELPRLEASGLADSEWLVQVGVPDKRLYRPTASGRKAFSQWLAVTDFGEARLRHPLLIRMWFGDQGDPEQLAAACRRHADELMAQRERFDDLIQRLDARRTRSARDRQSTAYRRLTLRHGLLRIDTELAWLREVQQVLGGQ